MTFSTAVVQISKARVRTSFSFSSIFSLSSFARAAHAGLTDAQLADFDVGRDLVGVRTAETSYGVIVFGKVRVPLRDGEGQAFIHVRCVDSRGLLFLIELS